MMENDDITGVYTSSFSAAGRPAERSVAKEVLLYCNGQGATFALPRHRDLYEATKRMLAAAYRQGGDDVRSDLRDLLGVKECACGDD